MYDESVAKTKLKPKGSMDEKQCHDPTPQYPMNVTQSRISLHIIDSEGAEYEANEKQVKKTIKKIGFGFLNFSYYFQITSNRDAKMVCIVKRASPMKPVTA